MLVSSIISILNSKRNTTFSEEGVAQMKVRLVGEENKLNKTPVYLAGCSPYHIKEIKRLIAPYKELLKPSNGEVDVDLSDPDNFDLRQALNTGFYAMQRSTDYLPANGEIVKVQLGYVETKSGETALLVQGITPVQLMRAKKVTTDFFSDEPEESDFNVIEEEVGAES